MEGLGVGCGSGIGFMLDAIFVRRFRVGNFRQGALKLFAVATYSAILQIILGHQGGDFFRQRQGNQLIDRYILALSKLTSRLIQRNPADAR